MELHDEKKDKKLFSTKEVAFLVITTCILSFLMAMLIFNQKDKTTKYIEDSNLSNFLKQYNYIVDNYYMTVDKKKLIDGAIMGMLYSLDDPYAQYYTESSANVFNAKLDGYYEGIGIEFVRIQDGTIYILDVFEDSEAFAAGVKEGDIILSVDDVDVTTITQDELLKMFKNKTTKFKIKVQRGEEELTFEVKKSKVEFKSVSSDIVDNSIGYIKIDLFAVNTFEQFRDELNKLINENISGLIIDLRGNPGGHLTTAEEILSLLISKNKVIYQIDTHGKIEKYYSQGNKDYKIPIAVLVDKNSASAAELVTAALNEQLGAIIIGQTTYGKGTVQDLVDLPEGVQYKVTTKEWLTSLGKKIQDVGITPTIEIEETDTESYVSKAISELKLKIKE